MNIKESLKNLIKALDYTEIMAPVVDTEDNYDDGEYDREGDMAKSDLLTIIRNAKELHDLLSDDTNLPEHVQSKIVLAAEYIKDAANYMKTEMEEEQEEEEIEPQEDMVEDMMS